MNYNDYIDPDLYKDLPIEPAASQTPLLTPSTQYKYEHPIHKRKRILRIIGNTLLRVLLYLIGVVSCIIGICVFIFSQSMSLPMLFMPSPFYIFYLLMPAFGTMALIFLCVCIVVLVLVLIFYKRPHFAWKQRLIYGVIITIIVEAVSELAQRTIFQHLVVVMEQTGTVGKGDMVLITTGFGMAALVYGLMMVFVALW